jgi:hypothetical protein
MSNLFSYRYARLNFSYDKERVKQEILQHFLTDIPAIKQYLDLRPFDLVPKELYEKITVLTEQGIVKGELPSWKGYSFTHVPGDRMSSYGGNLTRIKFDIWAWKDDANCPYIKEIVESLGFDQIQNIRSMILQPPGFGPVHNDVPPNSDYYNDHVSVTLNISNGGKPLVALIDSSLKEFNDDCFIFRDDCWHGVGLVEFPRIQLRINGKINADRLATLVDLETVI